MPRQKTGPEKIGTGASGGVGCPDPILPPGVFGRPDRGRFWSEPEEKNGGGPVGQGAPGGGIERGRMPPIPVQAPAAVSDRPAIGGNRGQPMPPGARRRPPGGTGGRPTGGDRGGPAPPRTATILEWMQTARCKRPDLPGGAGPLRDRPSRRSQARTSVPPPRRGTNRRSSPAPGDEHTFASERRRRSLRKHSSQNF